MQYFDVYVDGIKDLYTYLDEKDEYELGDNVIVPFRNTKKSGFLIRKNENKNFDFKVLNILSKMKNSVKLSMKQLELIEWLVSYYLASYDSVISAILPKKVKISYSNSYQLNFQVIREKLEFIENEIVTYILSLGDMTEKTARAKFKVVLFKELIEEKILKLKNGIVSIDVQNFYKLEGKNLEIFKYYEKKLSVKKEKIEKIFSRKDIKKLEEERILEVITNISNKKNLEEEKLSKINKTETILTEEQLLVKEKIEKSDNRYFLLKGVTGSGKTEVYLELIKNAFFNGEGSIFLVPEISLTPQMMNRFRNEFKNNIAILHSSLSDNDRAKEWEAIYKGEKKIVLGVRSAIFSPVKNLKYIILDEEHEGTYKQDSNPRYNAKYVAIKRCLIEKCKLILGSATPSIESFYYAKSGIYELLEINKRHGNSVMPDIEVVDMRKEDNTFFSKKLLNEIKNTLLKNEQVILFLNRKGYSTYIQCKECGHVEECPDCSIKMSYYSSINQYKCNYCGKHKKYSGKCSKCGSEDLVHSGKGIERIEDELKKYFDVPIIKADADLSKSKNYFQNLYEDFLNKKYSILIGTQIITKGLHFPDVTLVGVINSDTTLNFPDFRSGEKTFQLLTQVSGRAGRGLKKGKVIIQSFEPENTIIKDSREENYGLFYEKEIKSRKIFSYPPFSKIINVGFSSEDEQRLWEISNNILNQIKKENSELNLYINGPLPSLVYKVKKRFRVNIFIKGKKEDIEKIKIVLRKIIRVYNDIKVRMVVDIDSINLM